MRTIVSLTPLPLDRDSRTLKIAGSFARHGWRSIVVENRPSAPGRDTGAVEVVTLPLSGRPARAGGIVAEDTAGRTRGLARRWLGPWLRERLHLVIFIVTYFVVRPLVGLWAVPPADLYYLHEYRLFPMLRLRVVLWGRRASPIIYDAHDIYTAVEDPAGLSPFWRRRFLPLLAWMERQCAAQAAAVVTVSDGVGVRIGEILGVTPRIIRNCHDFRLEQVPAKDIRGHLGLGKEDVLVVVVGNRKPGQTVSAAMAAVAKFPGRLHLAFVGRHYDDVAAEAARLGVVGRVHTTGAVPPEQIVPFIRGADAAALLYWPHTANGQNILPNGFFQSLSAGLPLLYPALPALTAVIGDNAVGWQIDPHSTDSVAAGYRALLTADIAPLRAQVVRFAAGIAWEHEEKALLDLTQSVLDGEAGR